jgi:transposase
MPDASNWSRSSQLWANRRRRDLLELLDRLTPTIAELTAAIEQEVKRYPAAQRLQTHPGVGALTALAFVLTFMLTGMDGP